MPNQTFVVGEGGVVAFLVEAELGKTVTLFTTGDLLGYASRRLLSIDRAEGFVEPRVPTKFDSPVWIASKGSTVVTAFEDGFHPQVGAFSRELTTEGDHHAKIRVYDEHGNHVGYVPVYKEL